jgi:hypothetical protein
MRVAWDAANAVSKGRLMPRLLFACVVFLLAGCTTEVEPTSSPYALSQADISAVVTGVSSAHEDFDSLNFANLRAARSEDGHTYVCGWLSYKKNGSFRGEQRFFGTLSAGRFVLDRFGNGMDAVEVLNECHEHGIATEGALVDR